MARLEDFRVLKFSTLEDFRILNTKTLFWKLVGQRRDWRHTIHLKRKGIAVIFAEIGCPLYLRAEKSIPRVTSSQLLHPTNGTPNFIHLPGIMAWWETHRIDGYLAVEKLVQTIYSKFIQLSHWETHFTYFVPKWGIVRCWLVFI